MSDKNVTKPVVQHSHEDDDSYCSTDHGEQDNLNWTLDVPVDITSVFNENRGLNEESSFPTTPHNIDNMKSSYASFPTFSGNANSYSTSRHISPMPLTPSSTIGGLSLNTPLSYLSKDKLTLAALYHSSKRSRHESPNPLPSNIRVVSAPMSSLPPPPPFVNSSIVNSYNHDNSQTYPAHIPYRTDYSSLTNKSTSSINNVSSRDFFRESGVASIDSSREMNESNPTQIHNSYLNKTENPAQAAKISQEKHSVHPSTFRAGLRELQTTPFDESVKNLIQSKWPTLAGCHSDHSSDVTMHCKLPEHTYASAPFDRSQSQEIFCDTENNFIGQSVGADLKHEHSSDLRPLKKVKQDESGLKAQDNVDHYVRQTSMNTHNLHFSRNRGSYEVTPDSCRTYASIDVFSRARNLAQNEVDPMEESGNCIGEPFETSVEHDEESGGIKEFSHYGFSPDELNIPSHKREVLSEVEQSSSDKEQRTVKRKIQRLLLLRHATRCKVAQQSTDNASAMKDVLNATTEITVTPEYICPVTIYCAKAKQLINHIRTCKDMNCHFKWCLTSRDVLCHYRNCKDEKCEICCPVRAVHIEESKASMATQQKDSHRKQQQVCSSVFGSIDTIDYKAWLDSL